MHSFRYMRLLEWNSKSLYFERPTNILGQTIQITNFGVNPLY
jgi:hypothetical protein